MVPNTPPLPSTLARTASRASATSSPNTRMRSSSSICSCRVRRMASPRADDLAAGRRRRHSAAGSTNGRATTWSVTVAGSGRGAARARRGGRQHGLAGLLLDGGHLVGVEHPAVDQGLLHEHQRIVGGLLGQLVRRAVLALGVRRGVRVGPGHGGVDERRARPRRAPRPRCRRPGRAPRSSRGRRAVCTWRPRKPRTSSEIGRGRLVGRRHRDGEAVVGHHVEHGQVQGARGVEALPELAFGGGPLAERHVGQLVAVGRRSRADAAREM